MNSEELIISNKTDALHNEEKTKLIAEIASIKLELKFQNTEKETQARELITKNKELERLNKELSSFSYSVSHDLRAPVRAINGFVNILEEDYAGKFDSKGAMVLRSIINNSIRMGVLIDDLLSFSTLGRQEMVVSRIEMTSLLRSVEEELMNDSKRRIEFDIKDLPAATGDESLIRQVWINLLSNSIKFSKNKPITRIEIGGYEESNSVVYYVKDNGAGFDMKYYDKLFGVFQRLHSQREFEGTGMGLAIVQKIIHRHNGRVWAESTLNEGACFYFSLPVFSSTQ